MKAEDLDLSKFDYVELGRLHRRTKKEWVKRNKEKYTNECYKVGDIVKIKRGKKATWSSYRRKHSPDGEETIGRISRSNVHRDGRIRDYLVDILNSELEEGVHSEFRGTTQVEKASEEEKRNFKFACDIRGVTWSK